MAFLGDPYKVSVPPATSFACLPLVSPVPSTSKGAAIDLGRVENHALESPEPRHHVQHGCVPSISLGLLTTSLSLASGT